MTQTLWALALILAVAGVLFVLSACIERVLDWLWPDPGIVRADARPWDEPMPPAPPLTPEETALFPQERRRLGALVEFKRKEKR